MNAEIPKDTQTKPSIVGEKKKKKTSVAHKNKTISCPSRESFRDGVGGVGEMKGKPFWRNANSEGDRVQSQACRPTLSIRRTKTVPGS